MDARSDFATDVHYNRRALHALRRSAGILSVMVIALLSCEPHPLDVDDLKIPETRMVVSSMVLSDESVAVLLTESMGALAATEDTEPGDLIDQVAVNDAEVTLTLEGEKYKLTLLQDGIYKAAGIPLIPGKRCDLRVISKSHGEVTASTVIQGTVPFVSLSVRAVEYEVNTCRLETAYSLQDPPRPNYYLLEIRKPRKPADTLSLLKPGAYARARDDSGFDGQQLSDSFIATHKNLSPGDTIEVSLSSVSRDYYEYITMRLENQLELAELFSEPAYYPTNIKGGKGFFALHIPDVRMLVL